MFLFIQDEPQTLQIPNLQFYQPESISHSLKNVALPKSQSAVPKFSTLVSGYHPGLKNLLVCVSSVIFKAKEIFRDLKSIDFGLLLFPTFFHFPAS